MSHVTSHESLTYKCIVFKMSNDMFIKTEESKKTSHTVRADIYNMYNQQRTTIWNIRRILKNV